MSSEHRQSQRWPCDKQFEWRAYHSRRRRVSRLAERSLHGLVLLAEPSDAPPPGTLILPADSRSGDRHGFRLGVVKRHVPTDGDEAGIVVEILS